MALVFRRTIWLKFWNLLKADVLVLATPVYFYGICAQMKTFIDRTYPIWQHLGEKEVYYIISAGLGEDIVKRSLGDLDGFVEHLEKYEIKGRIYATDVGCRKSLRNALHKYSLSNGLPYISS